MGWLRKAAGEKLLREYVLYWQAQTSLALGQKEDGARAVAEFSAGFSLQRDDRASVTAIAQTALALGKGEDALAALDAYPYTSLQARSASAARAGAGKNLRRRKEKSPWLRPWIISTSITAFR